MTSSDATSPDDPRARAARTKRERTRRALLDAADTAFGACGWAETRVEDVARAAGVSAATAYNHFPSKHALVAHVVAPLAGPLLVLARQDVAAGRPVADALTDQVRALARIAMSNRRLMTAFWSAVEEYTIRVAAPDDPDDDADPRTIAPLPRPLDVLIGHGQRTGELRPYPLSGEAAAIIVNILLIRSANRPADTAEQSAELALTVLFGMLHPELLSAAGPSGRPFRPG